MSLGLKTSWGRQKPVLGSQLDRSHPLAQGLSLFTILNDGAGNPTDIASNRRASRINTSWVYSDDGAALEFNGADACNFAGMPSEDLLSPQCTVFCRFRNDNGTWNVSPQSLISKGEGWTNDQNGWQFGLLYDNIGIITRTNWTTVFATVPISSSNLSAWHTAVAVLDGTNVTIYMDGATVGTVANTRQVAGNSWNTSIGSSNAGTGDFLIGSIDYAGIYPTRALSVSEVASLYADPWQMIAPPPGLIFTSLPSGAVGLYVPYKYSQIINGSPFMGGN